MILIEDEIKDYFKLRTRAHLYLVHKWSNVIAKLNHPSIDLDVLNKERDDHDQFKFSEPEYTPYLYITWSYYCKRKGIPFEIPQDMKDKMHEATYHHIKNHAHHPEFWDFDTTINSLNRDNRDKAQNGIIIDATRMPLAYIASMLADWCAMSEELGTNSPQDWAKANINIRWKFTKTQEDFIYDILNTIWVV